jgi:hypothetical protein
VSEKPTWRTPATAAPLPVPAGATHRVWDDLAPGYYCVAWAPEDHFIDFRVYTLLGKDADGLPVFQDAEKAEVFLSGFIKWDGCANVYFDGQDDVMLHFCGKGEAMNVGLLLGRVYDLAAKLIPNWDGD